MLSFGGELSVSQTGDQQDDGPMVQEMPSEQIRQQLTQMSKALHHALQLIRPAQLLVSRLLVRLVSFRTFCSIQFLTSGGKA